MSNIVDYMDWRGDLTLSQSPFNEIDNLLLAEVCFFDWRGIVPAFGAGEPLSLRAAVDNYQLRRELSKIQMGLVVPAAIPALVKKMAYSPRFEKVGLIGYVNEIDQKREIQFSATTFLLPDETVYVAFRGTDDTLVGWKEDLNLAFMDEVPAQTAACAYLKQAAGILRGKFRIGGHSKGGNLAVYAAAKAPAKIQKRIVNVYDNDGPGFPERFFAAEGFLRIADKLVNIYPENSIVGMLFEHSGRELIVKSNAKGVMQHDGFSWQVKGISFEVMPAFSPDSLRTRHVLKTWMEKLSPLEKKQFCDSLFDFLGAFNAQTLSEVNATPMKLIPAWTKLPPDGRKMMRHVLGILLGEGGKTLLESVIPARTKKQKS